MQSGNSNAVNNPGYERNGTQDNTVTFSNLQRQQVEDCDGYFTLQNEGSHVKVSGMKSEARKLDQEPYVSSGQAITDDTYNHLNEVRKSEARDNPYSRFNEEAQYDHCNGGMVTDHGDDTYSHGNKEAIAPHNGNDYGYGIVENDKNDGEDTYDHSMRRENEAQGDNYDGYGYGRDETDNGEDTYDHSAGMAKDTQNGYDVDHGYGGHSNTAAGTEIYSNAGSQNNDGVYEYAKNVEWFASRNDVF